MKDQSPDDQPYDALEYCSICGEEFEPDEESPFLCEQCFEDEFFADQPDPTTLDDGAYDDYF